MTSAPRNPIFVMGAMGSGTTLMRLILDSHDDVAMAQETGFARALMATEHIPFATFEEPWYHRIGWEREEVERELADFYDRLFGRFAAQRAATRWGDKTPFHVWYIELLARVFPDAVFIGMVRHPGAGAHSRTNRMGHSWHSSVAHWTRRNNELAYRGSQLGDRFVLCRYEELVTRPEPLLRELLDWLQLPWTDRVLAFDEVHRERGTPSQVEGWTMSDQPLDPSRVDAWTREMTAERWASLRTGQAAAMAQFLGYRAEDPLPAPGWGAVADTVLLDGSGVQRLMAARPGVDWDDRPQPPFASRPLLLRDLRRLERRAARGGPAQPAAAERVAERALGLGRWLLLRLPTHARRPVRGLWWRVRDRLRR